MRDGFESKEMPLAIHRSFAGMGADLLKSASTKKRRYVPFNGAEA